MIRIHEHDLPALIGRRASIGLGNACAEPQTLIDALIQAKNSFESIDIYGMIHYWTHRFESDRLDEMFRLKVFMVDPFTAAGQKKGSVEYIPCRYSQIPDLFHKQLARVDTALISVSPPDSDGNCTFGVSCDFTKAIAANAKTVIAEINNRMPRVGGDNMIHIDEIDYALETNRELPQVQTPELTDVDRKIGEYVSQLVEDGATIQVGIGRLSEAALQALQGKQHLGIHSGLIADGVVDLVESGTVDNSRKGFRNGVVVGTTFIGTNKLFEFVNCNKAVESFPSDFTHSAVNLSNVRKLHAINSAIQVDLTGQVNAETIGGTQVSGVGGQSDFVYGAQLSRGGKSIIVLPSTTSRGRRSKIVPALDSGASVTSLRHDVDYVVTEYGIASLKGKTLRERARELIAIAHPNFRDTLESARRKNWP